MRDLWNFSFFGRGNVSPIHSELLSLGFWVTGETSGLISRNNFVKKFDVTRSSLCSGVKECGIKRARFFLFPKSSFRIRRTTVLVMFKDSVNMLDATRQSFLTKSATTAMFTSVPVDFGRQPLSYSSTSLPSRNREYHLKTFDRYRVSSHKPFAPILVFLSQIDRLWNKILLQLSVRFLHSWRIKKTDFTRQVITRTLSKINKWNSVCERVLVDST